MYPIFTDNKNIASDRITYIQDIDEAYQKNFTKMFWFVPSSVNLRSDFSFSYTPNSWETEQVHLFKNGQFHDGVILVPKSTKVTKEQVLNYDFKKPVFINTQASTPKFYDGFRVYNYEDYLEAYTISETHMFWIVDGITSTDILFTQHFPGLDNLNNATHHIFKINNIIQTNIMLTTKDKKLSKDEFDNFMPYDYNIHSYNNGIFKQEDYKYDVVFISYNEPQADENYQKLLKLAPHAKRVHGVKGIHQAHIEAAKLCTTEMFWVVDGDAQVVDDFDFEFTLDRWPLDTVYVWRSKNPVNGLIYGYGGVKLLPRKYTLRVDLNSPDMTTSIGNSFEPMEKVSNITAFNTDPFNTWKSAFRECAKLASKTIREQINDETETRLEAWCTLGEDSPFGQYSINGSIAGRNFGNANRDQPDRLKLINDFEWLYEQFSKYTVE